MMVYLLKIIVCSGLLLLAYQLLLEKEKCHVFKRFYLLAALIIPLLIPFLQLNTNIYSIDRAEETVIETLQITTQPEQAAAAGTISDIMKKQSDPHYRWNSIFFWSYLSIALTIFIFRFSFSLFQIFRKTATYPKLRRGRICLVLTDRTEVPHSFFRYVFVNKIVFEKEEISVAVLDHEALHAAQAHSLDILLLEFIRAACWINPFLFLYTRAIKLNHEFLADDYVIRKHDIPAYQQLLLQLSAQPVRSQLASHSNYSITKKRFVMMSKINRPVASVLKQLCVVTILGGSMFLFSSKLTAQEQPVKQKAPAVLRELPATGQGATKEQMEEYKMLTEKSKKISSKGAEYYDMNIPVADRNRLEEIFKQMNEEQRRDQVFFFRPTPAPFKKVVPGESELEKWKDEKTYGVWIDEKRIKNSDLEKYTNTDFSHVFVSKLSKNATNYGKHYVQVNLMTNSHFETYLKESAKRPANSIWVRNFKAAR